MEIILKKDVENLGFADDVVTVKNGYGRNFLIPQGKAILATISAKKALAEKLKQSANKDKSAIEEATIFLATGVIGFGGGSPMDVAKLTALMLGSNDKIDEI